MAPIALIRSLWERLEPYLHWLPPLLTRITLGWEFKGTGWGKIHHHAGITDYFTSLHIPFPSAQAYLASYSEWICGWLLLVGLCTRLAAVPLAVIMVVALCTAIAPQIHEFFDLLFQAEFLALLLLIWLIVRGPGAIAIDRLLFRHPQTLPAHSR